MAQNLEVNGVVYNGVEGLTLKNTNGETVTYVEGVPVPAYVKEEASRVVDTVITRAGANPFRFVAFSDAHQKNDDVNISNGNRDCGHGIAEVLKLMGAEFVSFLGDSTWASSANDTETSVIEQQKAFNRYFGDALKGEDQLRLEGNHETDFLSASTIQAMIYGYNRDVVRDANHPAGGYCYRDFEDHKIRVVCVNTNQLQNGGMSGHQLSWFAHTALNMTGKTDWSLMILSHHPMDFNSATLFADAMAILDAFIKGKSVKVTTRDEGEIIDVDFAEKNCAFIANFHGHAHSFSVVRLKKYVNSTTSADVNGYAICIPNACFTRNNQYAGEAYADNPWAQRYTTEKTYNKTVGTAESTSFNVVTVCTENQMIYLDVYGAGIDREVLYRFAVQYTNQIPISTDTDGSIYNGKGFAENMYLSNGVPTSRSGIDCSGFIPFGVGSSANASGEQFLEMSGISATNATTFRIAFYDAQKAYLDVTLYGNQFDSNGYEIKIPYKTDADGNYTYIDFTAITAELAGKSNKVTAFIRICCPNIDGNSILTVNEPIT